MSIVNFDKIPKYEKNEKELEEILPFLKSNFLTKSLADEEIKNIAFAMKKENFTKKDTIIRYGDMGTKYYILSKGNVKVTVYKPGTDPKDENLEQKVNIVKYMKQGVGFGELALLYNDKRSATIQAEDDVEVYSLDGLLFKGMIVKSSI